MNARVRTYIIWFALMLLTACVHDRSEYGVDFSALPANGRSFVPFREQDVQLEAVAKAALPGKHNASSIDAVGLLRGLTEGLTATSVHQVSGTYQSVDAYGSPVTLSGAVYYPENQVLKGIIVASHYTVTADYEVPSQSCFMDAWLATKGYALIMPDYMGYGVTRDSVPPYMQADLTARHVIDMALAVRTFFAERKLNIQSSEIILMGYSQGAHASIHALRLIEDHENYPEYKDAQLRVKQCCVGGGPYYVSAFYQLSVAYNYIPIPCSVPMLMLGMNVGRSADSRFEPAFFFSERTIEHYQDWILSKRYTVDQLNGLIGTSSLNEILSEKACDFKNPQTISFYNNLLRHDVPEDFVPKAPLYVFHSSEDDVVSPYHSQRLQDQLNTAQVTNVTYDFGKYGVHGFAYVQFLMKIFRSLP